MFSFSPWRGADEPRDGVTLHVLTHCDIGGKGRGGREGRREAKEGKKAREGRGEEERGGMRRGGGRGK